VCWHERLRVLLQYLTFTRSDIAYAVQQVCLHMHDPHESHLTAVKCILRYLKGTLDHGLLLHHASTSDLIIYTDADWAGCLDTRGPLWATLCSWVTTSSPSPRSIRTSSPI
jgi:hypothetical protein